MLGARRPYDVSQVSWQTRMFHVRIDTARDDITH